MIKVLVIAKAFPPVIGGVETYSEEVTYAYLRNSFDVTVLTSTEGPVGWREIHSKHGGFRLFNTGVGAQSEVFLRLLVQAAKIFFQRGRFDFIHATTWRASLAAFAFARSPVVVTVHGREVLNYPFYLRQPMVEVLRRASVVATVSGATMEVARGALHGASPRGAWVVALNGISFPEQAEAFQRGGSGDDSGCITMLSLARLVPRKNIHGCIRALSELRREGFNRFKYLIGGTGPLLEDLKLEVEIAGLKEHVRFLGYVENRDLPTLYQSADVFLHPQTNAGEGNDFEGFGLVIADAMSFGCAVVAGDAGGPRDFIEHRETGLLVDGLDHEALKSAIRSLMLDEGMRIKISSKGRSYALQRLSWDNHVNTILGASAKMPVISQLEGWGR